MSDDNRGWEFFAGFLLGSVIGAAAALLFAPQSGEETREEIRERGIELQGRMGETTEEARRRAEVLADQARQRATEAQERGRLMMDEQRTRLQDAVEQGREAANRKREELNARLSSERSKGGGEENA